jgi:hypothetical protein
MADKSCYSIGSWLDDHHIAKEKRITDLLLYTMCGCLIYRTVCMCILYVDNDGEI